MSVKHFDFARKMPSILFTFIIAAIMVSSVVVVANDVEDQPTATASTFGELRQAIQQAGATPTTIYLTESEILLGNEAAITIAANQHITILNGQIEPDSRSYLIRNGAQNLANGRHFIVNGTLNLGIEDGTEQSNNITLYNETEIVTGDGGRSGGIDLNQVNANLRIHDGVILRHLLTGNHGGAVNITNGTFTMYGGILEDNFADAHQGGMVGNGGAVRLTGSNAHFVMHDGIIQNNRVSIPNSTATTNGGAVAVENGATFTMNGGSISNNVLGSSQAFGGGVWLHNSAGTTFTMNDGIIEGNSAFTNGGGIWVGANATFNMRAGTIRGNTVSSTNGNGGGIFSAQSDYSNLNIGYVDGIDTSYRIHFYENSSSAYEGSPLMIQMGVEGGRIRFPHIRWENWLNGHHTATTSLIDMPVHLINNWDINTTTLTPYTILRTLTMVDGGSQTFMSGTNPEMETTGDRLFFVADGSESVTIDAGTRFGYTFSHWSSEPEIAGIHAQTTARIENVSGLPTQNVTVTAHWDQMIPKPDPICYGMEVELGSEIATVSTWAQFQAAYNNSNVARIVLLNDLTFPSSVSLTDRRTSLEIDGCGFTFYQRSGRSLPVNTPAAGYTPVFHLHNVHLGAVDVTRAAGLDVAGSFSFIQGSGTLTSRVNRWRFRIGNLSTDPRIARVVRAYQGEITLYGELDLNTRAENFYAGSIIIEDGTNYRGNINFRDYSLIWFPELAAAGTTGASREFTVGDNVTLTLTKTAGTGATYPAIFDRWETMTIGENSVLDINFEGPAFALSSQGATFTAQYGSVINLTRRTAGPVLTYFSALGRNPSNASFTIEPGASLYVTGTTNGTGNGLINMDTGTGNRNHRFVLNNPASFDLRNNGTSPVIRNGRMSRVEILDSDISLWRLGANLEGDANGGVFTQVDTFSAVRNQTTTSLNEVITSSDASLQSSFGTTQQHRRIMGGTQ
ncbi:MAG: hypothetical protein FWG67_10080 [Defluviitaleaceae bacterium]|nr:hypothetical protein [Defluviitaleaceae bacterium]